MVFRKWLDTAGWTAFRHRIFLEFMMIKMVFAFLAIFTAMFLGIQGFISATGREQLQVAKIAGYSSACAALAMLIIVGIVVLF